MPSDRRHWRESGCPEDFVPGGETTVGLLSADENPAAEETKADRLPDDPPPGE